MGHQENKIPDGKNPKLKPRKQIDDSVPLTKEKSDYEILKESGVLDNEGFWYRNKICKYVFRFLWMDDCSDKYSVNCLTCKHFYRNKDDYRPVRNKSYYDSIMPVG